MGAAPDISHCARRRWCENVVMRKSAESFERNKRNMRDRYRRLAKDPAFLRAERLRKRRARAAGNPLHRPMRADVDRIDQGVAAMTPGQLENAFDVSKRRDRRVRNQHAEWEKEKLREWCRRALGLHYLPPETTARLWFAGKWPVPEDRREESDRRRREVGKILHNREMAMLRGKQFYSRWRTPRKKKLRAARRAQVAREREGGR